MAKRKRADTAQEIVVVAQKKNKTNDKAKGSKPTLKNSNKSSDAPKKQKNAKNAAASSSSTTKKDNLDNSWSKSKKKRMRRLKSKTATTDAEQSNKVKPTSKSRDQPEKRKASSKPQLASTNPQQTKTPANDVATTTSTPSSQKPVNSKMQGFMERLKGSRFRELNEELYTTTSASALERFSSNPELYQQYHDGFRHQVENWPVNPVDAIVQWLKTRYYSTNSRSQKQKQLQHPVVVADFGCGDAALAKALLLEAEDGCRFQVHSFDLVASCDLVTACDMAHTPLPNQSVDVGIFCLSLMGTNLADFIREAHRVLKSNGRLQIAEVRSRFANKDSTNPKEDDLPEFLDVMNQLGFRCRQTDRSNTMFVLLELEKNGKTPNPEVTYTAKPCFYKRR